MTSLHVKVTSIRSTGNLTSFHRFILHYSISGSQGSSLLGIITFDLATAVMFCFSVFAPN